MAQDFGVYLQAAEELLADGRVEDRWAEVVDAYEFESGELRWLAQAVGEFVRSEGWPEAEATEVSAAAARLAGE